MLMGSTSRMSLYYSSLHSWAEDRRDIYMHVEQMFFIFIEEKD
jgi:hypothetical protein